MVKTLHDSKTTLKMLLDNYYLVQNVSFEYYMSKTSHNTLSVERYNELKQLANAVEK